MIYIICILFSCIHNIIILKCVHGVNPSVITIILYSHYTMHYTYYIMFIYYPSHCRTQKYYIIVDRILMIYVLIKM